MAPKTKTAATKIAASYSSNKKNSSSSFSSPVDSIAALTTPTSDDATSLEYYRQRNKEDSVPVAKKKKIPSKSSSVLGKTSTFTPPAFSSDAILESSCNDEKHATSSSSNGESSFSEVMVKPQANINTVLTVDSVLISFNNFIDNVYVGKIDDFFADMGAFFTRFGRGNGEFNNEEIDTENNDNPTALNSATFNPDLKPSQLFESFISPDGNDDTSKWIQSMKLPTVQAINAMFTSDLIGLNFEDLVHKSVKGKITPSRKSFTSFLNNISRFQCFIKPNHMSTLEWKGLEDLIIGYVVDKVIHFFIAKKITFKEGDVKRVRNQNGTYNSVPSMRVKNLIASQLKDAMRKRCNYVKKMIQIVDVDEEEKDEDSSGEEEDQTSSDEEEDEDSSGEEESEDDSGEEKKPTKTTSGTNNSATTSARASPPKRKAEDEVSDTSATPGTAAKKVIVTEPFPNNPAVTYTYGFFNEVKQNSVRAQALLIREKAKAKTPSPSGLAKK
jgi:hypothetical protein